VERQPGVDDILDEQDVLAADVEVEVLEQPDRARPAGPAPGAVARQFDEVDPVDDGERAREVGEEDEARLQAADQDRLAARVVLADLVAELSDPRRDLACGQVDLPDPPIGRRRREIRSSG
jgi:hypothetical protein